jgi:hypothetical protein
LVLEETPATTCGDVALADAHTVKLGRRDMLDVIGSGPLMSPSLGVWDLVLDLPETSIVLVAVLFTMAMTGIALAVFGGGQSEPRPERVSVIVRTEAPRRRARRRRR